jgi:hypothetical protein
LRRSSGTGDVLMFAWMNREALQKTAELGRAVYFSRSRGKLWFKGEESGHVQRCTKSAWTATTTWCCSRSPSWATSRHCLPHRAPQLFFQRLQGRRLAGGRAGLERP